MHSGQCLVPLADIFNHKASVVEVGDDYTVAELDDASSDDDANSDENAPAEDAPQVGKSNGKSGPVAVAAAAETEVPRTLAPDVKRPRDDTNARRDGASAKKDDQVVGGAAQESPAGGADVCGESSNAKKQRVGDVAVAAPESNAGACCEPSEATVCAISATSDKEEACEDTAGAEPAAPAEPAEEDCPPACPGGLPCCVDSEEDEADAERRIERLQQLQDRLGVNLGLEIAIIDDETDAPEDAVEEDDEGAG